MIPSQLKYSSCNANMILLPLKYLLVTTRKNSSSTWVLSQQPTRFLSSPHQLPSTRPNTGPHLITGTTTTRPETTWVWSDNCFTSCGPVSGYQTTNQTYNHSTTQPNHTNCLNFCGQVPGHQTYNHTTKQPNPKPQNYNHDHNQPTKKPNLQSQPTLQPNLPEVALNLSITYHVPLQWPPHMTIEDQFKPILQ